MYHLYGIETESAVQQSVCDYLRYAHPNIIFRSDFASGLKLSKHQAAQHKRLQSGRAFPDMFIYEPRHGFYGLAIELKRSTVTIHKRDGTLVADAHIREQAAFLEELRTRGYKAEVACGIDEAINIIKGYLGDETEPLDVF